MNRFLLGFGAVLITLCQTARADFFVFTTQSAWAAAAGTTVTEDFADTTLQTGLSIVFGQSASISGGTLNAIGSCIICESVFPSTRLNFSPAVAGFGGIFDLTPGGNGGGLDLEITLNDASVQHASVPALNTGFIGVLTTGTTSPITSVLIRGNQLTGNGEAYSLDNLQFTSGSTTTVVPEPGSVILLGTLVAAVFGGSALKLKRKSTRA